MEQPVRCGKRHNITSTIKGRVKNFWANWSLRAGALLSFNKSNVETATYANASRCNDQEAIAAAISSKLQDSNIKQRSEFYSQKISYSLNQPRITVRTTLQTSAPLDRPKTPVETSVTPFQTSGEVRKHIRSFPAGSSRDLRPLNL